MFNVRPLYSLLVLISLTLTTSAYAEKVEFYQSECVLVIGTHSNHLLSEGRLLESECESTKLEFNIAKESILFREDRFVRQNMSLLDFTTLIGYPTSNEAAPISDSIYFSQNYDMSNLINQRIYVNEKDLSQIQNTGLSVLVPLDDKIFGIYWLDSEQGGQSTYIFSIRLFKPVGIHDVDMDWGVNFKSDKGLIFTEKEAREANQEEGLEFTEEDVKEQTGFEFTEEEVRNTEGYEFSAEDVKQLSLESDEALLLACAAGDAACTLDVDPQDVRDFMKVSTKEQAYEAIQQMLEEQVSE